MKHIYGRASLGLILKQAREAKFLSVRQVAKATGLSAGSIGSWEKGRSYPWLSSLLKLMDFYGITTTIGVEPPKENKS